MEHGEQIWLLAERLTRVETSLGYEVKLIHTQLDLQQRRLDQLTLPGSGPPLTTISLFPNMDIAVLTKVLLALAFPLGVLLVTGDLQKALAAMKGIPPG